MNSQFTNPWTIRAIGFLCFCITLLSCTPTKEEITLTPADQWSAEGNYQNFQIQGQALTEKDAEAALLFHPYVQALCRSSGHQGFHHRNR